MDALHPVFLPTAPNPLVLSRNPAAGAWVRFMVPQSAAGRLSVLDASGRVVRRLAQGALTPGEHRVRWDGCGEDGRPVPAGCYYCCLTIGPRTAVGRITVVR